MAGKAPKAAAPKQVEALNRDDAKRKHIPTTEHPSLPDKQKFAPVKVSRPRAAERCWAKPRLRSHRLASVRYSNSDEPPTVISGNSTAFSSGCCEYGANAPSRRFWMR